MILSNFHFLKFAQKGQKDLWFVNICCIHKFHPQTIYYYRGGEARHKRPNWLLLREHISFHPIIWREKSIKYQESIFVGVFMNFMQNTFWTNEQCRSRWEMLTITSFFLHIYKIATKKGRRESLISSSI